MDDQRRKVLTVVACGAGVATATVAAIPAVGVVLGAPDARGPGRAARGEGWTRVAGIDELPEGTPLQRPIEGAEGDAWMVSPRRRLGAVFVLREGAGVRAWSAACPHVGCLVEWSSDHYVCRCHDSAFSRDGRLTNGVAPRGLDPLEARVENGVVFVRFERFRLGVPERERIG